VPTSKDDLTQGVTAARLRWLVVIVALTVIADQLSKQFVLQTLTPGVYVPFIGEHIGWQLLFNTGGAFGLPAPAWLFLLVAAFVTALVWRVLTQQPQTLAFLGFALLLGGAYGNIVDRLFRASNGFASGAVVDFVAWGSFPRFNVADAAITVGVACVFLSLMFQPQTVKGAHDAPGDDTDSDGAA
jgi:signal peptidase II